MDFTSLVKEVGIDKLPEDKQKTVMASLSQTLFKRVSLRMAMTMTEEQVTLFEKALDKGDDEALAELERVYPDFRQVCQEEIDDMKEDLLAINPYSQD